MRISLSCCVAMLALCVAVAGQPKYGVTVKSLDKAALANARTYTWKVTQPSFDKTVDTYIVAAIDRELTARGFMKLTSGGDVTVTYASLQRTDVDTDHAAKNGVAPQYAVGTLVIDITDPTGRKPFFNVRIDKPIDTDRSTMQTTVNEAVAAMFEKYPAPAKR